MSYKEDLGRVKGNRGATLVPNVTPTALGARISWTPSDSEYDGPLPEPVEVTIPYYIPQYNEETGNLEWTINVAGMEGYENIPEVVPMQIKGDKGDIGVTELEIVCIGSVDEPFATVEDRIQNYTNDSPKEGVIYYILGGPAFVYDAEDDVLFPIEQTIDLSNYYTKNETHEIFFTKQEVYDWLASIREIQQAIIDLLDNGVVNIPIEQGSGEVDYQTLRLIFNEAYSDEPIIYVDGIPWSSYEKTEDYLYLYQVPDGNHIIFYEDGNQYSLLECSVDQYHTEFVMPEIAVKPTYNQTIITTSNGEELYGCNIYFDDITDDGNNIAYHATDAYIVVMPVAIGYYVISADKRDYGTATIESENEYNTVLVRENGRFEFDLEWKPPTMVDGLISG